MKKIALLVLAFVSINANANLENTTYKDYPICSDIVEMEFNTVFKLYCESEKEYTLETMCKGILPYAAGGFNEADLAYDRYCREI